MGSGSLVVADVRAQDPPQRDFVEHNYMIQAFPTDRANQPLHVSILPRRMRSRQDFFDVHSPNSPSKCISVTTVSVADQKSWSRGPWKGFAHLLGRPFRSRMSRNVEVHDSSPMMLQQDEHEQELKVEGGHDKEIDRDKLLGVVLQECPPRLGRGLAVSDHVLGDSSFRNINPQFQQLSMNSGRTPDRIRQSHLTNQIPNRP